MLTPFPMAGGRPRGSERIVRIMRVGEGRALALALTAAALLAAGCAKIEPSPIERADGTIQYCPNPYNRHHVLMAARRFCAPEPAQPLGFEACPDDDLVDGWVFACRYKPGYDELELKDVRAEADQEDAETPPQDPEADADMETDATPTEEPSAPAS